jgi:hypothetical protein
MVLTSPLLCEHFRLATAPPEQLSKFCIDITNKKTVKETVSREDKAYVSIYEVLKKKTVSVELFNGNSSISLFEASSRF